MSSNGRKCLVAICHNGPVVLTKTAQSLMELGWGNRVDEAKAAHGVDAIHFMWATTSPRADALRDFAGHEDAALTCASRSAPLAWGALRAAREGATGT